MGGSLKGVLDQDGKLPEDSIHDLARDLVVALQVLRLHLSSSFVYLNDLLNDDFNTAPAMIGFT